MVEFYLGLPSAGLTFFQQQKKVSKKCRPSSAGEADFPQIALGDAQKKVAYLFPAFAKGILMGTVRKIMIDLVMDG